MNFDQGITLAWDETVGDSFNYATTFLERLPLSVFRTGEFDVNRNIHLSVSKSDERSFDICPIERGARVGYSGICGLEADKYLSTFCPDENDQPNLTIRCGETGRFFSFYDRRLP